MSNPETAIAAMLIAGGLSLCLSAGAAHLVYPAIKLLPPVLGFLAGIVLAAGVAIIAVGAISNAR